MDHDRLAVHQDLALIRLHQPVEDVHQRGLAGPVLAEQAANLTRRYPQIDVVVGHEAAEALRDAAQLEFHGRPSAGAAGTYPPSVTQAGPEQLSRPRPSLAKRVTPGSLWPA